MGFHIIVNGFYKCDHRQKRTFFEWRRTHLINFYCCVAVYKKSLLLYIVAPQQSGLRLYDGAPQHSK